MAKKYGEKLLSQFVLTLLQKAAIDDLKPEF